MSSRQSKGPWTITRREVLKYSGLLAAQLAAAGRLVAADEPRSGPLIRFGIVTDSHYADADKAGTRYYRESLAKMAECVGLMNEKKVELLVELGDFKDQCKPASAESTIEFLRAIEKAFAKFQGPRYHVLGNHDEDRISKAQFQANVENTKIPRDSTYYSFDAGQLHFVVLDANYCADGKDYDSGNFNWTDANVPKAQLDWLARDLAATKLPTVAFVHQQLDGKGGHTIKNAADVQAVLQKPGRVLAVFQGHNHAGGYSRIGGIHYYTLKAMIEGTGEQNNSYAIVEVAANLDITVTGYRKAVSKDMPKAEAE